MRPLLFLAVLVLASCATAETGGQDQGPASAPAPPSPTASPPVPPSHGPYPAGPLLTEADDGRRVEVVVGQEVSLQLSHDWDWADPVVVSGAAPQITPVDHLVDPGYREWLIAPEQEGELELTVDGTGACGDPQECPDRTLTITLVAAAS